MPGVILCVDDDRNLCQILSEALAGEGYEVRQAFDGDQALASLRESPPQLVLLDLILPRRDGFAVLEALREPGTPGCDTPVVIMTGCSPTPANQKRARTLGAMEMLTKPIALEQLLGVVARCLSEAKREKQQAHAHETERAARAKQAAPALSGSLKQVPLPSLLHHLHGLRASGVIHLASGRKRKWIQVHEGVPCAVRSNLVNECLGNFLVREGCITQAALAESRRRMKPGRLQGEVLVAMDLLSEDEIAGALTAQAEEKLFEAFSWASGRYRFERGVGLAKGNTLGLGQSPANLVVRGVRNRFPIEPVDQYLRSHSASFLVQGNSPFYQFQEVDLEADERELLDLLDGSRTLAEFLSSPEPLRRTLYALLSVELLDLRRPDGARVPTQPRPRTGPASAPAADDADHSRLMEAVERISSQDYFEILGIDPQTPRDQIRAAYERLASQMHPDRYSQSSQAVKRLAEEVFGRVNRAYETLVDPTRRKEYLRDRRRERREAAEEAHSERALEAEKSFRLGQAFLGQRDYERALEAFGKALELYPDDGEYHSHYGWALHLCHPEDAALAEEAIEHVKRGIKLAGHRESSYLFLGRLCKAIGKVGAAEKMFSRAVQIQPECVEALRELRLINMRRDKSKGLIGRLFGR